MGNNTSSSTYKGDSPGKKVARARLWINAGMVMTALDEKYKGAYVLAGEGGDVSTLKALGFDPKTITAVDLDGDYANFCGELYPGITTLTGEAGEWAQCVDYNAAHLDFCNSLTVENLDTARKVILGASSYPMCLSITMMKGREAPPKLNRIAHSNLPRHARKELRRRMQKSELSSAGAQLLMREKVFDPRVAIDAERERMRQVWGANGRGVNVGAMKKDGSFTSLGTGMVRIGAFTACLDTLLYEEGLVCFMVMILCYHSKSKTSNGTPFVCGNVVVVKRSEADIYQRYLMHHAPSLMSFEAIPGGESKGALRSFALQAARGLPARTVGTLFDVPRETVIAWRAHETRGTYQGTLKDYGSFRTTSGVSGQGCTIQMDPSLNPVNTTVMPMTRGWGNIVYTPEWEIPINHTNMEVIDKIPLLLDLARAATG